MAPIKTVLIVEDDFDSQQLLYFILRNRYHPVCVDSVDEAKKILAEQTVHLVLLDLSLVGDQDGLTLSRYIRNNEQYATIPIIAVTAHAFETDRENCMKAGCNEFVTKPIIREKLVNLIENLV